MNIKEIQMNIKEIEDEYRLSISDIPLIIKKSAICIHLAENDNETIKKTITTEEGTVYCEDIPSFVVKEKVSSMKRKEIDVFFKYMIATYSCIIKINQGEENWRILSRFPFIEEIDLLKMLLEHEETSNLVYEAELLKCPYILGSVRFSVKSYGMTFRTINPNILHTK